MDLAPQWLSINAPRKLHEMSFELEEDQEIADYRGICPKCGNVMTFYHDLRCTECNQKTILWCPRCQGHRRLKLR